jgi:murein DD-endopeptidase MepM/ murein hydrolase activator NlpD
MSQPKNDFFMLHRNHNLPIIAVIEAFFRNADDYKNYYKVYGENVGKDSRAAASLPLKKQVFGEKFSHRYWFSHGCLYGLGFTALCIPALLFSGFSNNEAEASFKISSAQPARVERTVVQPETVAMDPASLKLQQKQFALAKPSEMIGPKPQYPYVEKVKLTVAPGDTLTNLLTEQKVDYTEATEAVDSMKPVYNPRRIKAGQDIEVALERHKDNSVLRAITMGINRLEKVKVEREGDDFASKKIEIPTTTTLARAGGTITSSLYEAAADAGLSPAMTAEMIQAYSYDVDFQRDIKPGQQFDVLYESILDPQGNVVSRGNILYAKLKVKNKPIEIFNYMDRNGNTGFFKENGESIRKALLKTPISGARISSTYGMRRHPILGYSKMHQGVDFAASTGTPVYAAGDGVVKQASYFGSYGNYVKIQHTGQYASAYAHLSRYASGIRPGARVKQGQVIGYVGTTGRSTGPHLHYEIHSHGRQVNPQGVKFNTGVVLAGHDLQNFKKQVQDLKSQFASLPREKVALASR